MLAGGITMPYFARASARAAEVQDDDRLSGGMKLEFPSGGTFGFAADDLKGFARTFAEVEWLLLILVLLYMVFVQVTGDTRTAIMMALFFFGAFLLSFHYANFFRREGLWKLTLEALVMLIFITWVVWYTGGLASPLINLYLLAIIASALTLGKAVTLLILAIIAACYFALGHAADPAAPFATPELARLLSQLAPVLMVGYLTTMLAADIRYVVKRVEMLSQTDDLTGLLNMRGFTPMLEREAWRAERYKHPFSVLMVDCDNLKRVNDGFGHEAGNQLLRYMVSHMQNALRATDVLARYGGDEFLVLLPETRTEGARLVAERMRESVEGGLFTFNDQRISTSVSVGIASFPENGRSTRDLIDRADSAMYRSKGHGKNAVTAFS
jgi:diguanylate cyclase (GGDEF)-like protein